MIPPRRILFSGGGIKGIALIGALKAFEQAGLLKNVKEYCGVSVGSWIAFMLACNIPISTRERLVSELNYSAALNCIPQALISFPETFGFDDGTKLVAFIEAHIRIIMKLDPAITFRGLKEITDKEFRCWATDLTDRCEREFSYKETPDVKIMDALRASMAIPFFFTPFIDPISGHILSDGGIQGNLPLHNLTHSERAETFAIGFTAESNVLKNPETLMDFTGAVFSCLIHSRHEELLEAWKHHILRIPLDYPSWKFEASREDRLELMNKGYNAAIHWLKAPSGRPIVRRHSL